jgi:predicted metal-dependent phosphoesterase TrpH
VASPALAACDRHPHLATPVREGYVRVDLHTHTMWSGDSTSTPDELVRSIAEAALDVVCITDHQSIVGAEEIAERLPCRVVVGEEVRTSSGELIGLFLTKRIAAGGRPVEVAEQIREQGGVVYVPHPFDPMRRNLSEPALYDLAERGLLDAIEVLNSKTSLASLSARAADFAAEFDLAGGAGSDAHVPDAIGAACVEMPDFGTPAEFVAALRSGTILGHHWDEPRPWSPRIVPSTSTYRAS